jgi:MFS transporter, OFA family, oxalate/formate antiporter
VLFVAYGAQYSFGIFLAALLEEFHWSRASLSGVFSIYAFMYATLGSVAGQLTDRFGPRVVISGGALLLGSALAGMSLVTSLWQPYVLYGLIAGLGMSAAYVPCNATVVRWFVARRGLAVGLAMSGASAGTFVVPLLAQFVVSRLGWRAAYVIFGTGVVLCILLVAPLMRRDPESLGLRPDGAARPRGVVASAAADAGAWRLSRAIRSGVFWALAATFGVSWIPVFIPLVHLVPFARDLGLSPMTAAWVVSSLGAGAVAGRLVMGSLSDRIGRRTALRCALTIQGLACLGFLATQGPLTLFASAVLYGFGYAAVSTLFPALIGDYFGRAHAGAIVGALFAIAGSLGGVGPVVAGALYDATGGYGTTWMMCALLNALSLGFLALARPPARLSGGITV